jgi:flagellar protein FliO/FliZ
MLTCASVADAATGTGTGENTPLHLGSGSAVHAAAGSGSSGVLRTIIALIVVIGIIYVVARILKAIKGRDAVRASGNGLEQLATLPLAPGRSLSLVRSGRDIVLLGVGESGVSTIKTYTEEEAIAAGLEIPSDDASDDFDQAERPMDRVLDGLRRLTVRS